MVMSRHTIVVVPAVRSATSMTRHSLRSADQRLRDAQARNVPRLLPPGNGDLDRVVRCDRAGAGADASRAAAPATAARCSAAGVPGAEGVTSVLWFFIALSSHPFREGRAKCPRVGARVQELN
jgi:hypothetical protein